MTEPDFDDCTRVRRHVMATLDGEIETVAAVTAHVATCAGCREYVSDLQRLNARLEGLGYTPPSLDLWPAIGAALDQTGAPGASPSRAEALAIPAFALLALLCRAGQLLFDLPLPALHGLVYVVLGAAALRALATDALALETSIPELRQEGA